MTLTAAGARLRAVRVGRWAGGALIAANAAVVALLWAVGLESLDGTAEVLFANVQEPGYVYAIRGPFRSF